MSEGIKLQLQVVVVLHRGRDIVGAVFYFSRPDGSILTHHHKIEETHAQH